MRAIRPAVIATVGPALLGVAFALGSWIALPGPRTAGEWLLALLIGAGAGAAFFGPIAAVEGLARRYPAWLRRRSLNMHWGISVAMLCSLGYLIACILHRVFDGAAAVSIAVVGFGAAVKFALFIVERRDQNRGERQGDEDGSVPHE